MGAAAEPIKGRTWVPLPRVDQEEVLGDLRRRALKTTLASLGILWAAATILPFFSAAMRTVMPKLVGAPVPRNALTAYALAGDQEPVSLPA